jgi:hypothetical protein
MTDTHNPSASTGRPTVARCAKHLKNDSGRPLTSADIASIEGR